MGEWLNVLFGLSIAGSGVLIFSCLITYISKGKINAKWHYWNRKLSLFLFLIPIFIIPELLNVFIKDTQLISLKNLSFVYQNTVWFTATFVQIVFIIWLLGVIVTGIWYIYRYRRFNNKLKANLAPIPKESTIQHCLSKNMKDMKLKKKVDIVFCQISISPVLIGVFKTTIILPMYDIPYDELDMIIKHELTHYKKKDLWIKKIMLCATILHWYNPFIHLLRKEVNKWCELSCDEDVVMEMSHAERKKYGETILNTIQRSNQNLIPSFLGAPFSTGQITMKNRLLKMLTVKNESKLIIVLSASILIVLGSIGIVSSALTYENTPVVSKGIEENDNDLTTLKPSDVKSYEEIENSHELNSIKRSGESSPSDEEWAEILNKDENNEVVVLEEVDE